MRDQSECPARIILETIHQYERQWGSYKVAAALVGSTEERIRKSNLFEASTYGALKNLGRRRVEALIDSFVNADLLRRDRFQCLRTTEAGRALLAVTKQEATSSVSTRDENFGARSETLNKTLQLLRDGATPQEIATSRAMTPGAVSDHLLALAERGECVDLRSQLQEDRLEEIRAVAKDWRPGDPLKEVRSALSGSWQWPELKTYLAQYLVENGRVAEHEGRGSISRRRRGFSGKGYAPQVRSRRGRRRSRDAELCSRGYLPHLDRRDRPQFITYRLADALPAKVVRRIQRRAGGDADVMAGFQKYLDAGHGACWLQRPEFAEVVVENLHFHDGKQYRLLDWVVMPNHVHVAYDRPRVEMRRILHGWKSYTAHKLKPLTDLGGDEPFWQHSVFDRYIRNQAHLTNVMNYIYLNPVKAGLVRDPFDWDPSSIHQHDDIRPKLRSWLRAQTEEFWTVVEG